MATSLRFPEDVIHGDPARLGGTPVFVGTRVPVQSLFDYLEAGDSLNEFLHQFPSVGANRPSPRWSTRENKF